jgi:hypothetical protein
LVGHIARDSTAIEARERFEGDPNHNPYPKRKLVLLRKAERALCGRHVLRRRRQSLPEMLENYRHCRLRVKKNSSVPVQYWPGYKLHLDCGRQTPPISCLLTARLAARFKVGILEPASTCGASRRSARGR